MTVKTEHSSQEYLGNGVATEFSFNFPLFEKEDAVLVVIDKDGNISTLTLDVDYSIPGRRFKNGGKAILNSPLNGDGTPDNSSKLIISRDIDATQEWSVRNQGSFNPIALEKALDKLTMLNQECLKFSPESDRDIEIGRIEEKKLLLVDGGKLTSSESSVEDLESATDAANEAAESANKAASDAGIIIVGDYVDGTVINKINEGVTLTSNGSYWRPVSVSDLPITINATAYPNPEDHVPPLKIYSDINSSSLPNYTDIVYKAYGGNSAAENMIAGNPISAKVGQRVRAGANEYVRVAENGDLDDFDFVGNAFTLTDELDLTGGTYVDSELIKYLDYARARNLSFSAKGVAKIKGDQQIDLGSGIKSIDFTGLKFVLDTTNNPFVVNAEYTEVDIDYTSLDYGQLVKGAMNCPTLSAYEGMFFTYVSNNALDPDLYRKSGTIQPQLRRDCTVIGKGGALWYPLRTTLKLSDSATIKATPIDVFELVIKGFHLECVGDVDNINVVAINRSNVKFVSPRYSDGGVTNPIPVGNLFATAFVFGFEIENPILDPIGDSSTNSYVINYWVSCNITISGMQSVNGWAETDGNYSRNIATKDSTVKRVGGHYLCSDMQYENIKGSDKLVETSGSGMLSVKSCKQVVSDASSGFCTAVAIRGDYGAEWDGQIIIDDLMVDLRGVDLSSDYTVNVVQALLDSSVGNHNFGRRVQLPTVVNISNVTVFVKPNQAGKVKVRAFVCGQTGVSGIASELMYPKHLTVDNVAISDDNGSTYNFVEVATILGHLKPQTFYRKMKIDASNVKSADPVRCGLNPSFSGSYATLNLNTNNRLDIEASLSDCDNARLTTSNFGDSKINVRFKGGSLITIGNPDDSDSNTNYEILTSFKGTRFDGAFKCQVMPGAIFKKYLGVDGVTVQAIGFPNNLEDNLKAISGVITEKDAVIYSSVITSVNAFTGYVDSSYYEPIA